MSTWILVALALAAIFVLSRLKGGNRMSSTAITEMIASGAQVLDVRTPAEYQAGAYPGARNIPVQALGSRLGELRKDKPIVVYCAAGGRAATATSMLKQAGFSEVVNAGGLMHMPR
ncbi:Thiosulfate sulfurtransferase PspE precursor [compost metagenome]